MNSERVGWKRRDIPRVKQRDNDVTKISGVVGGKSHYGSGDPQIPLKVVLEHRIFVGNISYKVSCTCNTFTCMNHRFHLGI